MQTDYGLTIEVVRGIPVATADFGVAFVLNDDGELIGLDRQGRYVVDEHTEVLMNEELPGLARAARQLLEIERLERLFAAS